MASEDVITVRVWLDTNGHMMTDLAPVEATVVGAPHDRFIDRLADTFGVSRDGRPYSLVVRGPRNSRRWLGRVDPDLTMSDAAEFADGYVVDIDSYGRGSGSAADLPATIWEMMEAGLTLYSVIQGGALVSSSIRNARGRRLRQLARDWIDAGSDRPPSMELRQAVLAKPQWSRRDFDRSFGLERESGSKLLRAVGFQKIVASPEVWEERQA